jgi:peroxiredoxin
VTNPQPKTAEQPTTAQGSAVTDAATTESVVGLLSDLHAHRVLTMDPADLQINIDQRQLLEATAQRETFVRAGDVLGPVRLPEVDGGVVDLDELLEVGPVVLVFFRFEGCPACNIALPHYQRTLYPGLAALGATLVAVSPQVPERLVAIKDRFGFEFPVASDPDNSLGRQLGIVFASSDASREHALAKGSDLGATLGTGKWELPMPTVVVVGPRRVVRFADVHPDWLVRTEAGPILDAVASLVTASAPS